MADTSLSLLDRLRDQPDAVSWQRLVDLYTPLIRGWLHGQGVAPHDADDVTQEVLAVVVRELPQFRHGRRIGSFRSWLRAITVNRLRALWRARQTRPPAPAAALEELEDPTSSLSRLWEQKHDEHVMRRLLQLIEPEFNAVSWQAFRRVVLEGERPTAVAADLGVSVNVVLLAKSRILRRLRDEARGLID